MITELDKVQKKVAFWLHWLAIVVTSVVLAVLGLLVGLMICPDKAESAQASVSYLHGDGYSSGDNTRNVVRFDALAVKDWGMVYGSSNICN